MVLVQSLNLENWNDRDVSKDIISTFSFSNIETIKEQINNPNLSSYKEFPIDEKGDTFITLKGDIIDRWFSPKEQRNLLEQLDSIKNNSSKKRIN